MKKILIAIGALLLVVIIALVALVTLVNPNQFKPLIVEQVKGQTGLELSIDGDLSWQFFPQIGFQIGHVSLSNPEGFSEPKMVDVESVSLAVDVMPLLDHTLSVANVQLNRPQVVIETLKSGKANYDVFTQTSESATDTQAADVSAAESSSEQTAWAVDIGGVELVDAQLTMVDGKAGTRTAVSDVNLKVSDFAFDTWSPVSFAAKAQQGEDLSASVDGKLSIKLSQDLATYAAKDIELNASAKTPDASLNALTLSVDTFVVGESSQVALSFDAKAADMDINGRMSTQLTIDKQFSKVDAKALTFEATAKGKALPAGEQSLSLNSALMLDLNKQAVTLNIEKLTALDSQSIGKVNVGYSGVPDIVFSLTTDKIDVDALLASLPKSEEVSQNASATTSNQAATIVEPDLSALRTLSVDGKLAISKVIVNKLDIDNIKAAFTLRKGVAKLSSLTADLLDGSLTASGQLNASVSPATYNVSSKISSVQIQPLLVAVADNDMLEGTGNVTVTAKGSSLIPDKLMKAINGNGSIELADGAVNGINVAQMIRTGYAKVKGNTLSDEEAATQKTDFSSLTATFTFSDGVAKTDDLSLMSPLLRVHGEGSANYIAQTTDFLVRTSIVGSLKGQGGQTIDDLKDVTIPLKVTGAWTDPQYKLVFDDVLKAKAKKEVEKAKEKLKDKLLNKLFN